MYTATMQAGAPIVPAKRVTNEWDKALGLRIRGARIAGGMTQEDLGGAIEVSFQQVQKYENGVNRVSAYRLCQIATVLQVNLATLLPDADVDEVRNPTQAEVLSALPYGERACAALAQLPVHQRQMIAELVEQLAAKVAG
jgi:transcriptional regulator with XRE-family HTH domain